MVVVPWGLTCCINLPHDENGLLDLYGIAKQRKKKINK